MLRLAPSPSLVGIAIRPGDAGILGVVTLEPTRRITLLEAAPLGVPDDVEVRATRINFVADSPTGPGVTCTRQWPPDEFTLTQPLAGAVVDPADFRTGPFVLTFYLTKSREGTSRMNGFRVRYEDERGRVSEQTFDHPIFKLTMHDKHREFRFGPCLGFPRDGTAP